MPRRLRRRYWLELFLAVVSAVLLVLTLARPDWIEVSGWDPDRHGGEAEWFAVAGLAVASATLSALARLEWRRSLPAT
jgi:hypothetical protein